MMGTMDCVYETPCGWCSKWDKKCDKQISEREQVDEVIRDKIKEALVNKMCQSDSDHEWECIGMSTVGSSYRCKKCGSYKNIPVQSIGDVTVSI